MRKAVLQRCVAEATAGSHTPVGRSACALEGSTPTTLAVDGTASPAPADVAMDLTVIGGERSIDDTTAPAVVNDAQPGKLRVTRDTPSDQALITTQPGAEATLSRFSDNPAGQDALRGHLPACGCQSPSSAVQNDTESYLERIPHTLPCHVMTARVCGASRRSLVVAGTWSPSSPRDVIYSQQLAQPQDSPRAPTRLESGALPPLTRAVEAATRRGGSQCSA
jgi:hypothetical protein